MPRFPIKEKNIEGDKALISGTDYKHIVKVLRLREGDTITLFDECSREYTGKIAGIGSKEIVIDIISSRKVTTDSPLNITLLQGLTKGDKMDYIVEKATELGVHTIVPVITERSQVRTADKKRDGRGSRLRPQSSAEGPGRQS